MKWRTASCYARGRETSIKGSWVRKMEMNEITKRLRHKAYNIGIKRRVEKDESEKKRRVN